MRLYKIFAMLLTVSNIIPVMAYSENTPENITYNDFKFTIRENCPDELILTEYTGSAETLNIPENIEGYTITAIDSAVFMNNQTIKNVTLPDTINYFGSEVFRNSSLVSVNIPKSLKIIPDYSFNNCPELETVVFHDDIILMSNTAFKKTDIVVPRKLYDKMTNNRIESSDTTFEDWENNWHYSMISEDGDIHIRIDEYQGKDTVITVPDSIRGFPVTELKQKYGSFIFSDDIKSITFPETITELNAIFVNSSLEEITLPNIDEIPAQTFLGCKNLRKINFQGNPESFTIGDRAFVDCNIDFVPYPESCKNISIGKNAFQNTTIKELRIDVDSIIDTDAFSDCKNLSYVELNNTSVKSRVFQNCPLLEDVAINGKSFLEEQSFYDCDKLKNITIPDLKNVSMTNAVYNCPELMTINNKNAFDGKTGDFHKDFREFIFNNFSGVDEVGFINEYVKAQAEKIVSEITTEKMSDVQKIKAVHDWVCRNTVYDDGLTGDRKNHNDASVLMNDSTVCEGYARIANILYNTAGIETYYISGVGHAWNVVRAGNNYFHVDTTWDDGDNISYDWFMKSDDEIKNSDSFHASWKTYIPSSLHNFQEGKILPECSYSMGDVNQDKIINVADMVILNKYILGQDNIDYDNYILSDLTADGVVDSFDLVRMRQLLIK
ncbi:MAG: leucine-rich repeat protein [Ruminococcus sp.]|nr:leucine-rich repeat protein [Ruminococcus sp.]